MIYFIQQGEAGPIKIGYSEAPDRRRVSLQAAHSEVLGLIADAGGTRADEARLHERYARHRLRGEWFAPAPEIVEHAALLREIGWLRYHLERERARKCPVCPS